MLAAAVDAGKGFLVKQAYHAVFQGGVAQDLHHQLVVIRGGVGVGIHAGQLILAGSHLFVLRLGEHPQPPKLIVHIPHKVHHPGGDGAEVVILQLLALGGGRPQQGAGAEPKIRPQIKERFVHQEVFLLRSRGGDHPLHVRMAEQGQDPPGLPVDQLHGAQQGGLFIQGVSAVGAEDGGDAQGLILDKGVAGGVPGGIAPGLEGGPQPAGGEAGGVRLAHDQLLGRKLQNGAPVLAGREEPVVLFRRTPGQRLEPVGIMGGALFHRPVLHGRRHFPGNVRFQGLAAADGVLEGQVGLGRKPRFHGGVVEYQFAEGYGNAHGPSPL